MLLLKLGMLVGFQGAVIPKMQVTYNPASWFYMSQALGIDVNGGYSNDIAQFNLEAGGTFKQWQLAIGHEAVVSRDIKTIKPFNYVEISYKKEF